MTDSDKEVRERLAKVEERQRSDDSRIKALTDTVTPLVLQIARLATSLEHLLPQHKQLVERIDKMEGKPGKKFESVTEKAWLVAVGAGVMYILSAVFG